MGELQVEVGEMMVLSSGIAKVTRQKVNCYSDGELGHCFLHSALWEITISLGGLSLSSTQGAGRLFALLKDPQMYQGWAEASNLLVRGTVHML